MTDQPERRGMLAYSYGGNIKLWHDDIRKPPDDTWAWARTNGQALDLLIHGDVVEASLDHDLGMHELDPDMLDADIYPGTWDQENDGCTLIAEMIRLNKVPPVVTIHSWNPPGAERMRAMLADVGVIAAVRPFAVSGSGGSTP